MAVARKSPAAYAAPTSLEEAVRLAARGDVTLLAGGTDLMPQTRAGRRTLAPLLLNLTRVPELRGIAAENGSIRIGALATVTEILESRLLRERAPILPETADCFAGGQVRNGATIGGNIANASPAGDLIIPLLLLDAEAEIAGASADGTALRRIPLRDLFTGPGATRIASHEILISVSFPIPREGLVAGFRKFGVRPAMDISVVSVGIAAIREKGRLSDVRVAFGAVAPIPMRGVRTEKVIEGRKPDETTIREAARVAAEEISPISDPRASAWYRTELTQTLTARLLRDVGHA